MGDFDTIGSDPCYAKNVLVVGAAESFRVPDAGDVAYDRDGVCLLRGYDITSGVGEQMAEDSISAAPGEDPDVRGVAAFSCRGPLPDGRIRPDVVAPGTRIVSTRLDGAEEESETELLGGDATAEERERYLAMDGTSMATPLTAGACAVLRQWCREALGVAEPDQALVRALLFFGAESLYPGQYGDGPAREIPSPAPNGIEGFGLVSLQRALTPAEGPAQVETFASPETGTWLDFPVEVTAEGRLRAVLVWLDYPAQPYATGALVNDLDLALCDASGAVVAYPNGLGAPDRLNPAERIDAQVAPGAYTLRVRGHRVPFPGGRAALVHNVPGAAPAPLIAHTPLARLAPGEAATLQARLLWPAAEGDALTLETSADGRRWEAAEGLTLVAPLSGPFHYRLRAGETVAGPYAVAVGGQVPLTVASEGPFFPANPAIGQTMGYAAGEALRLTALPARTWEVSGDFPDCVATSRDTAVAGWRLTDRETGAVLALGLGGTADFAMPTAPATLTWLAEAPDPERWVCVALVEAVVYIPLGGSYTLPAINPSAASPDRDEYPTGFWLGEDGSRHAAGDTVGPLWEDTLFEPERLTWRERYFGDAAEAYDPAGDPDGDGYANAEEEADRTDPFDPDSFPTPPAMTPFEEPPARTPCASWGGQLALVNGTDASSPVTLLAQTRLPGDATWRVTAVSSQTDLLIRPLAARTEYRVGVADGLGMAARNGAEGVRPDRAAAHVVWGAVHTLVCTDASAHLQAALAADGTLRLVNLGRESAFTAVVSAEGLLPGDYGWGAEVFGPEGTRFDPEEGEEVTLYLPNPGCGARQIALLLSPEEDDGAPISVLAEAYTYYNRQVSLQGRSADLPEPGAAGQRTWVRIDLGDAIARADLLSLTLHADSAPFRVHEARIYTTLLDAASGETLLWGAADPDDPERWVSLDPGETLELPLGDWFDATLPAARRRVCVRSSTPAEPPIILPWPRQGYRLRLR